MIKKLISLLLIYAMLLHCGSRLGLIAYFYLNQDYIARVLCINQEKPIMQCNGRCYLSKKLQAQQTNTQQVPAALKTAEEINLFFQSGYLDVFSPCDRVFITHHSFYLLPAYLPRVPGVFQPPRL